MTPKSPQPVTPENSCGTLAQQFRAAHPAPIFRKSRYVLRTGSHLEGTGRGSPRVRRHRCLQAPPLVRRSEPTQNPPRRRRFRTGEPCSQRLHRGVRRAGLAPPPPRRARSRWMVEPAPALELHADPPPGHREVACAAGPLVVPAPAPPTTLAAAHRFFRRRSRMTRASRTWATKPGREKRARTVLGAFTAAGCPGSCTTSKHQLNAGTQHQMLVSCVTQPSEHPLDPAKTHFSHAGGRYPGTAFCSRSNGAPIAFVRRPPFSETPATSRGWTSQDDHGCMLPVLGRRINIGYDPPCVDQDDIEVARNNSRTSDNRQRRIRWNRSRHIWRLSPHA